LPKGESLLWNAWSYLLRVHVDDEGTLLESEWEAEEILKELLHTMRMGRD